MKCLIFPTSPFTFAKFKKWATVKSKGRGHNEKGQTVNAYEVIHCPTLTHTINYTRV